MIKLKEKEVPGDAMEVVASKDKFIIIIFRLIHRFCLINPVYSNKKAANCFKYTIILIQVLMKKKEQK